MTAVLRLLSWPDYVNPVTLQQFKEQHGITVEVETVPGADEMLRRMRADGPSPDVLCPPDYVVRELSAEGALLPLDHAALPNLTHLQPRFRQGRPHDPESRVSIVKDWGTTGYMHRTDSITETPTSWADFWALAEKYSGRVTVLDSPGEVIGAALKMRGHSYNAGDEASLAEAELDLLTLKPHLRAFETNYRPLLQSGEAWLALGWNGDAAALNGSGVPIRYVVPTEGSQVWEDDWAIAARSAKAQVAHQFLNLVLSPEVAAQEARYTGYATGNAAALALLDEKTRADASIYPPADVLAKLEAGLPLDAESTRRREALWAKLNA